MTTTTTIDGTPSKGHHDSSRISQHPTTTTTTTTNSSSSSSSNNNNNNNNASHHASRRHHHHHHHRSRRRYLIERSLIVAIAVLVSAGLLYSNKLLAIDVFDGDDNTNTNTNTNRVEQQDFQRRSSFVATTSRKKYQEQQQQQQQQRSKDQGREQSRVKKKEKKERALRRNTTSNITDTTNNNNNNNENSSSSSSSNHGNHDSFIAKLQEEQEKKNKQQQKNRKATADAALEQLRIAEHFRKEDELKAKAALFQQQQHNVENKKKKEEEEEEEEANQQQQQHELKALAALFQQQQQQQQQQKVENNKEEKEEEANQQQQNNTENNKENENENAGKDEARNNIEKPQQQQQNQDQDEQPEDDVVHNNDQQQQQHRDNDNDVADSAGGADNKKDSNDDDNRLNIVLFYADDWTMRVLGKLDSNVHTPNIDNMVDNGMLFVNNCVTTSVCWISRATLMTGTYYSRHLQASPGSDNLFSTHNWNETLFPRLRRDAGYHTGMVGKWHAPQPKTEMDIAFDDRSKLYYGAHWMNDYSPRNDRKMEHVTELNRRHSIEFLQNRPKDKKFALKVSFFATHAKDGDLISYNPMNSTRFTYYPDDVLHENYTSITPPKTATDKHWKDLPYFFGDLTCGRLRWKNRFEPHVWQKNIRDLYAMATEVDWAIGEIIDELKRQKVENDTMLVFTTDNGDLHGEHGLVEKWYPFEESLKVPLVIQDPRMSSKHHGTINKEWTLNVDLAPTLLGAAGLEATDFMQGRDISELYLDHPSTTTTNNNNNKNDNKQSSSTTAASGELQQQQRQQRRNLMDIHSHNHTMDNSNPSSSSSSSFKPWRKDWFYEWNMGDPQNASGHQQEHFIDAAFALITDEWKYIYWPQKVYEQLYHRSLDPYDEYDILQNYYLHQKKIENRVYIPGDEIFRMKSFHETNMTPVGDSVQSTMEIYNTLKARFHELKKQVQSGYRI